MKKLYVMILVALFGIAFVACGEETTAATTQAQTTAEQTTQAQTTQAETAPVFEGVDDVTINETQEIDLLEGITASDEQDGDLTSEIVVEPGDFTNLESGSYTINIYVEDSAENRTEASFTVTVNEITFGAAEWAYYDAYTIELGTPLELPKWSDNGTYFYWSSDNPQVITTEGFIINPPVGSDPVDVVMTCRAINGTAVVERDFVVTVQPNQEVSVTSKVQLPFEGTSTEYVVTDQTAVDVFYVDDGTVPYMDVQTFIDMVDGAIESSELALTAEGNTLTISYDVEYLDWDEVTTITETYTAVIDFTENTFTVNNFDFFSGYQASTESDYGSGLVYTGADEVLGQEVTIPLGDYNFDLVTYDDGGTTVYLMPFHVLNLLILGDVYYDAYYNGDKIWGVSTLLTPDDEMDQLLTDMRTSSLNSEAMAEDMKLATYNYMALVIDFFYGLREDKNIESGYDIMSAYAKSLITGSDTNLYNKLFDIAYGLDDLHTSHSFPGYFETPYGMGLSISDLGPGTTAFYEGMWAIEDLLDAKYGSADSMPDYELLNSDTIAVIHLTGFTIDTPDEFKAILDGLPSSVEDVVIDLAYNTGGNLGAVLRIWGYMTEDSFNYHSQNPADGSAVTYYIESDYVAYDYNWYVLTSSVTFSAANLFANIAKEMGVPVLGQDSSGGASSIGAIITPDGTGLIISTNNVLSTRVGNEVDGYEYLSIEYGIEVDHFMTNVYSDSQLIAIINQIKGATS